MARPLKQGVNYFPLDVTLDMKFELLEAEFGLKAFAIVVKLYQLIYGQQGYYCEWNTDVMLLFAKKNGVGGNVVSEIVNAAVTRGIFDAGKYEEYGILTSHGIQSRYCEMKKGDISKIDTRYLLLNSPENRVSEEKTGVSEEKTSVYGEKTPQRKVKESKVNKNKGNKSKTKYAAAVRSIVEKWNSLEEFGIPAVIKMTSEMSRYKKLTKLIDDFGTENIFKAIDNIKQSEFLLGNSERAWKIDFDFFVRPDKFVKILEGGYASSKKSNVNTDHEQREYDAELLNGFVNADLD